MATHKKRQAIDSALAEDDLIQGLINARGKRVEVIAFGLCYIGQLEELDIDNGTIVVRDGEDRAMIEIERVESLSLLAS